MILLDGKSYRDELIAQYEQIVEEEQLKIKLAIIFVGNNPASTVYVNNKIKFAQRAGMETELFHLDDSVNTEEVKSLIDRLNADTSVTGIILQSPAGNIDFDACAGMILPQKDIDGFTTENIASLYKGEDILLPCTVKGIIKLLLHYNISLDGQNVVIVGRGNIVGKPLALALTNRNATVTLCHSKTKDLSFYTKRADILISAVGKPNLIKGNMVKEGFIGVDVGTTRVETIENGQPVRKLKGDFDFESVSKKASYITPVPGGIGPMTVACVVGNLLKAKRLELELEKKSLNLR